jgi:hypothetical protein
MRAGEKVKNDSRGKEKRPRAFYMVLCSNESNLRASNHEEARGWVQNDKAIRKSHRVSSDVQVGSDLGIPNGPTMMAALLGNPAS